MTENEEGLLYLVCSSCGEAFDEIQTAYFHSCNFKGEGEVEFTIKSESEAM